MEFFESTCYAPALANGQTFFQNIYAGFSFPKHFHDEYLVQVITKGQNTFYCDGHTHTATPGDVVFINAGEIHDGTTKAGEKLEYNVFYINSSTWKDFFGEQDTSLCQTLVKDKLLFNKIVSYFGSLAQSGIDVIEYNEKYVDILAYIAGKYATGKKDDFVPDYHYNTIELLKEYIQDNLGDKLLLEDLSKLFSVSPFHLLRIFSKNTGLTLHQFIMVRRIEKARQLLIHKTSIIDITFSLGFSDQSHFTRSFKRMTGLTPKDFQKNVQI